jgi:hypothetical protein
MLFNDLEVYSDLSITEVPFDVYANHPSTKIILGVVAEDDGPDEVYEEKDVPRLLQRIGSYEGPYNAWNVSYERAIYANPQHRLKTDLSRWVDTMVLARYVGLPGALKKCVTVPELASPPGTARSQKPPSSSGSVCHLHPPRSPRTR